MQRRWAASQRLASLKTLHWSLGGRINCWLSRKSCKTNAIPIRLSCTGCLVLISMQEKREHICISVWVKAYIHFLYTAIFLQFHQFFGHCFFPVPFPRWRPQRVHCPCCCPPLPFLSNQIAYMRKCQQIRASIHIWWRMNLVYCVWSSRFGCQCNCKGLNGEEESQI